MQICTYVACALLRSDESTYWAGVVLCDWICCWPSCWHNPMDHYLHESLRKSDAQYKIKVKVFDKSLDFERNMLYNTRIKQLKQSKI